MLLGGFLFGSCVVFMTFVLLNLLLSVILVAFDMELVHHQVLTIPFREVSSCFLSQSAQWLGILYQCHSKRAPEIQSSCHRAQPLKLTQAP